MATISDLRPSITEIPFAEALKVILKTRAERKIVKNTKPAAKAKSKKKPLSQQALLNQMTDEQKQEVIKMLMAKVEGGSSDGRSN